jgi:hypothetical protein
MRLRDLFIALSLANLCYLRVWSELLTYTRSDTYLMKLPPASGRVSVFVFPDRPLECGPRGFVQPF